MQSEISRARRHMGNSAKSLCEIGLKMPSNKDEKTPDVGLLGGAESSVWSSERLEAVLLGFWAASEAPHGGPGGEPNPSRNACHSLPSSTSNHTEGLSACLITERCRRAELGGWGRRLFVNECHLFMDQWMRFGDRDRRIVLCSLAELCRVFPPQPSEPALPAVRRRGLFCQSRSSSEIHSRAVD